MMLSPRSESRGVGEIMNYYFAPKLVYFMMMLLLLMSETTSAANSSINSVCWKKNINGIDIYHEHTTQYVSGGRGGRVEGRTVTEFLTDRAAKNYVDDNRSSLIESAVLCTIIPGLLLKNPYAGVLGSLVCGYFSDSKIGDLRAGDRLIERRIGFVAGGVGGVNELTIHVAIGKRDQELKVLFVISSSFDKELIARAIQDELKTYPRRLKVGGDGNNCPLEGRCSTSDWHGTWDTTYGSDIRPMKLKVNQNGVVTGSYNGEYKINGELEDENCRFRGTWTHPNVDERSGPTCFNLVKAGEDVLKFKGSWAQDFWPKDKDGNELMSEKCTGGTNWIGTKMSPRP